MLLVWTTISFLLGQWYTSLAWVKIGYWLEQWHTSLVWVKTRRLLRQLRGPCLGPFTSGACSYSVSRVESEDTEKRAMECGESTECVSTSVAQAR